MRPGRTALNYWCSWKQKLLILLKEKHMWDETLLIWITLDLAAVHCSFILLNVFFFGGMRSVHACYALSCYVVCPVSHNLVICLYLQGLSLGHGESQPSHLTHQLQRYTHTHYSSAIERWTMNLIPWCSAIDWSVTSLSYLSLLLSYSVLSSLRLRIQPSSPPPTQPSNHLFRQPNQSSPPGSAGIMQGHG